MVLALRQYLLDKHCKVPQGSLRFRTIVKVLKLHRICYGKGTLASDAISSFESTQDFVADKDNAPQIMICYNT